ncbi:AraC family transcriptional regulator [Paenibacillus sp. GCM10027626]|uniref:AraC family transcriptional regulator n=1 Tax=Paenibacillus sp. GCM10027626 TaxID=3273411 RepID=UPI0036335941
MSKYPIIDSTLSQETFTFPIVIGLTAVQQEVVLPHHHQFYEISIYIEGAALDVVNGEEISSVRGTVICKLPHRIHGTRPIAPAGYKKYNLMFDMDILLAADMDRELKRLFHFSSNSSKLPFFQLKEEQMQLLERLCIDIHREYLSEQPFKQSYIRSKLIEILIVISRSENLSAESANRTALSEPAPSDRSPSAAAGASPGSKKINQALQYIHSHYLMDLSLEGLAAELYVSAPYLSRMIKQSTGKSFTDYVHDLRIEMSCSLLVSTSMSILDVSIEAGYSSFKTFSRVFLKKKGMSSSKYRQHFSKVK